MMSDDLTDKEKEVSRAIGEALTDYFTRNRESNRLFYNSLMIIKENEISEDWNINDEAD